MPCAVLQAEDSKGISAVIQWREAHSSREVPEGTKLLSFTLCRSLYLHIAKKKDPKLPHWCLHRKPAREERFECKFPEPQFIQETFLDAAEGWQGE